MRENTSLNKKEGSAFWNANPCGSSSSWDTAQALRFRYTDPYLVPILRGPLLRNRRVLEVGCGQGLDAERIVQQCRSYVGIDLSSVSVEQAREVVDARKPADTPTKFRVADAENLPFANEQFDVVYSIGVLHHTADFDKALAEIHRVLAPGGCLILMLYRRYTPLWLVLRSVRGVLKLPVVGPAIRRRVVNIERQRLREEESIGGTAMLELFGCPIINTYTLRSVKVRFDGRFSIRQSSFFRVGLEQAVRILPKALRERWPQEATERIERRCRNRLGFYMVIIADRF